MEAKAHLCKPVILASASPRRSEILTALGVDFEVVVSNADENVVTVSADGSPLTAGEIAENISVRKACAVRDMLGKNADGKIIIAADTVVCIDGELLGKPHDASDAVRMLRLLSGREHSVISGLTVIKDGKVMSCHEESFVTFKELSERETEYYIGTGEPFGKAGAYAVQGAASLFIKEIKGDFFNIVGLPVHRLYDLVGGPDALGRFFDVHGKGKK